MQTHTRSEFIKEAEENTLLECFILIEENTFYSCNRAAEIYMLLKRIKNKSEALSKLIKEYNNFISK